MAASLYQQWQYTLLEWRHSPCLMRPVSMFLLIIMLVFSLLSLALNIPTWLLGFLLAPVLSKGTWLVEFLYPLPIARWGHLFLLRWSQPKVPLEDKAASYHSRTLEQRVEVVPERVYVHPIPQLLDNLGYLVVCLAPPVTTNNQRQGATPLGTVSVLVQQQADPKTIPIVAFVVDCGDAESMQEQVQLIHKTHYPEYPAIRIQMILSTHKHHDHTAGNLLWNKTTEGKVGQYLDHIVGGAVEKVPGCNMPVADGDRLTLPSYGSNDLNEIANVEVVAVPAHTRGSVVYLLRANSANTNDGGSEYPACFAFTGDTMFSGGGGVPFEAGSDSDIDRGDYKDDAHADIRADRSTHAVERCFAEILYRGMSTATTAMSPLNDYSAAQDHFLVFPGHEYTTELLTRQFGVPPSGNIHDANKWKNFPPHVFFETVSQLYVALHRRSLPQATGKVLAAVPTTLRRELFINPHLRSLARRAELVVHAIRFWDAYFSKPKGPKDEEAAIMRVRQQSLNPKQRNTTPSTLTRRKPSSSVNKTPFNPKRWNMDTGDAAQTVFTTLYTTDLDAIIDGLSCGKLDPEQAAIRLEGLKTKLSEPVIRRRPIPGTLPSERVVHKGLVGFALLGSRPSAMTLSDSRAMKLPAPAISDTSGSLISKKRLIGVLGQLGFLEDSADGQHLLSMIHALWQEAHEYASVGSDGVTQRNAEESKYHAVAGHDSDGTTSSQNDKEEQFSGSKDLVELGTLKWILYGFPAKQPTWFSKFCMPCRGRSGGQSLEKLQSKTALEEHPVHASRMQRRHGELVRHDVLTCKICQSAAGFQGYTEDEGDDEPSATKEVVSSHSGSSSGTSNADSYSAMMVASADDHSVVEDSSIEESVEITSLPAFREA